MNYAGCAAGTASLVARVGLPILFGMISIGKAHAEAEVEFVFTALDIILAQFFENVEQHEARLNETFQSGLGQYCRRVFPA